MVKVGDTVVRMLAGTIRQELKVTEVTHEFVFCGPWKFNKEFGYEVDEDLGWGVIQENGSVYTGSFLLTWPAPSQSEQPPSGT